MADADMDVDDQQPTTTTTTIKTKKEGKDSSKARFEVKKVSNGNSMFLHLYCDDPDESLLVERSSSVGMG